MRWPRLARCSVCGLWPGARSDNELDAAGKVVATRWSLTQHGVGRRRCSGSGATVAEERLGFQVLPQGQGATP